MSDVISSREQNARVRDNIHTEDENLCLICSTDEEAVYHQHFSSRWLRGLIGVETSRLAIFAHRVKAGMSLMRTIDQN